MNKFNIQINISNGDTISVEVPAVNAPGAWAAFTQIFASRGMITIPTGEEMILVPPSGVSSFRIHDTGVPHIELAGVIPNEEEEIASKIITG